MLPRNKLGRILKSFNKLLEEYLTHPDASWSSCAFARRSCTDKLSGTSSFFRVVLYLTIIFIIFKITFCIQKYFLYFNPKFHCSFSSFITKRKMCNGSSCKFIPKIIFWHCLISIICRDFLPPPNFTKTSPTLLVTSPPSLPFLACFFGWSCDHTMC